MQTKYDEAFEDIAETTDYYPGSRQPILRHPNRPAEEGRKRVTGIDPEWDAKPRLFAVNGSEKEFFTVGQLASALGRRPVTIRMWEREGIIPKATFQIKAKNDDPRGRRRLYSRAQVEGLVKIAMEEGVLITHLRPLSETRFTERAIALFQNLK